MGDFTNFTIVVANYFTILAENYFTILAANYFTILASNYFTQPLLQNLYSADQLSGSGDLSGVVILEEEGVWLARARREVESQAKKMLMQGLELMVSSELRDFPYSILVLHCASLQQLMVS